METQSRGALRPWITAYRKDHADLAIEPAARKRDWMEALPERFANRCLPLLIANQAGWVILNDRPFEAQWRGGSGQASVRIRYLRGAQTGCAVSHFGHGILTLRLPYLFRTSPGFDLLVRGPANLPKDGIAALEGIVETDWAVAPFTMNWKFTRPRHRVRFEAGEPIAMLVPVRAVELESFAPRVASIEEDATLAESFRAWQASRAAFMLPARADQQDDPTWQKHYMLGTSPDGTQAREHRQKLKLEGFR